jgi:hypothetical protein
MHTLSSPFSRDVDAIPIGNIRRGVCATANTFLHYRIDNDGLGSTINPINGYQLWITAKDSTNIFHWVGLLFEDEFDLNKKSKTSLWDVEAIVIGPGTRLRVVYLNLNFQGCSPIVYSIMKPNTPHAVYAITNSIYHKGHFFASSTMKDTFSGIIHSFMTNTNSTSAPQTRRILRRLIVFYHSAIVKNTVDGDGTYFSRKSQKLLKKNVQFADPSLEHIPNLESMESVMDVIMACAIGIFINVLDMDTYRPPMSENSISEKNQEELRRNDFNAISQINRMSCTYTRGLSWSLLEWLDENLIFVLGRRECVFSEVIETYFVDLCLAIRSYKIQSEKRSNTNTSECKLPSVDHQLTHLFDSESRFHHRLMEEFDNESASMDFDISGYAVKRRQHPPIHKHELSVHSMILLGLNPADRLYYSSIHGDIESFLNKITNFDTCKRKFS